MIQNLQCLELTKQLLDLNIDELFDSINEYDFINNIKFLPDDLKILTNIIKKSFNVIHRKQYSCSYEHGKVYSIKFILMLDKQKNITGTMQLNNYQMLDFLSKTERRNMIMKYIKLSQDKFKDLLVLAEQVALIQTLRQCISLCDVISIEKTYKGKYIIAVYKGNTFIEIYRTIDTLLPTYDISNVIMQRLKQTLKNKDQN